MEVVKWYSKDPVPSGRVVIRSPSRIWTFVVHVPTPKNEKSWVAAEAEARRFIVSVKGWDPKECEVYRS